MPLDVIQGLESLKLRRPTDEELATLEPVHMTKDVVWDPSKYDLAPSVDADWFAAFTDSTLEPTDGALRLHGTTPSSSTHSY